MKFLVSPEDFTAEEEITLTLTKNNVEAPRRHLKGSSLQM